MTAITQFLVGLTAIFATGCALVPLPKSCEVGPNTDPYDGDRITTLPFIGSDPVRESLAGAMREVRAKGSARTMDEISAERAISLITWKVDFPRCPDSDQPVAMRSRHLYGRMVLARSFATSAPEAALNNRCWRKRFQDSTNLFNDEAPELFCDSLDPELVINTTARAKNDIETREAIQKELAEQYDYYLALAAQIVVESPSFYRYEYISETLAAFPEWLKDQLVLVLPKKDRVLLADYHIALIYNTDVLFIRVNPDLKQIKISAPVLRGAFANALALIEPDVRKLRETYQSVRSAPKKLARFRADAIDTSDELSARVLKAYQRALAFVIAHELAHIYGASDGIPAGEDLADCLAVANILKWNKDEAFDGLFDVIVDDFVQRSGSLWTESPSESTATDLQARRKRIVRLFEAGKRKPISCT